MSSIVIKVDNRRMFLSKHIVCDFKESRFIKEQEAEVC